MLRPISQAGFEKVEKMHLGDFDFDFLAISQAGFEKVEKMHF